MATNEFIIVVGAIMIGIIFFLAAQTFLMGSTKETVGYNTKALAERISSIIERLSSESSYAIYCINTSLINLKVENGYMTLTQRGESYNIPVSENVENVNLKEVAHLCFIHNENDSIEISSKPISCNMNGICEQEECGDCCPDCSPSDCSGDGVCERCIGENCGNSIDCPCNGKTCCPSDPSADNFGCVNESRLNLSKGEECFCDSECNASAGLTCNPTTPSFTDYEKACCEPGKSWNGTNCTLENFDVLIVALKQNLESVYISTQINTLENKIKEFQSALENDGLSSMFLYLDEDETSNIIGSKVTDPQNWSNIDAILDQLIPKLNSSYLIIIGGYDRFPQASVGSLEGSDDPYGDYNGDGNYIPDIAVGRFPDPNNGDIDVILNALDTAIKLHNSGGLDISDYIAPIMGCGGYDNRNWNSGKCFCSAVWGTSCSACGRCCGCISPSSTSGKGFVMILAHGPGPASCDLLLGGCFNSGSSSCMGFTSFGPQDFQGINVSDAVWMSMACGGGHLRLKDATSGSIAMTFLKNGGAVYFGSTDLNYGDMGECPVLGGDGCIGSLYAEVATRFSRGERIGDAYKEGKNDYFTSYSCGAGTSYQYHINCLYGDPTLKIKNMW